MRHVNIEKAGDARGRAATLAERLEVPGSLCMLTISNTDAGCCKSARPQGGGAAMSANNDERRGRAT